MTEVSFGEWLKRQRSGRGLTQVQLAHQIGCAVSTLRKIESEERRPSASIIQRLAEIFEIPQNEHKNFLKYARGDGAYAPGERNVEAPWLLSAKTPRTNLPASLTALIGRARELVEIHSYLLREEVRLLTLIGPPGIGKTRLSLEAARQSLADFPDGVFFVQLAPLENPILIAATTRQALGYVENQKLSADRQLLEGIGERNILLVLDNCEHLVQDAATFALGLLSACPNLKILATSRESLRIPGEWLYTVPPFELPQLDETIDLDDLSKYPALRLFAERARAARPDFVLTAENIKTVSTICARLDGLPLAIELIAAQTRVLSPQSLLERLNDQFILSVAGARNAPARQISLSHAIRWSYDFLAPEEQKLFAYLSVFSGGFTLPAAEAVFSQFLNEQVPALITALLDKSLLGRAPDAGDEIRFSMLATIRNFARERLQDFGDMERTRDRHLTYFLEMAEQAEKEIHGPQQLHWLDRLECELDNLRAALTWALECEQADAALRLSSALLMFWFIRGYLAEGIGWLEKALSQSERASKAWEAKALRSLGSLLTAGENRDLDRILNILERSLRLYQELEDKAGIAWVLNTLGVIAFEQKEYQKAKRLLMESLVLRYETGDPWTIAHTLQNFAPIAFQEDNYAGTKDLTEETIEWFRRAGDQRGVARTVTDLAELEQAAGNLTQAVALLKQSLLTLVDIKDKWSIAFVLEDMAALAIKQKDFQRAVQHYGAAEALREAIGMPLPPYQRTQYEHDIEISRKNLDAHTFSKAWAEGHAMTLEQAVAFALEEWGS